MNTSSVVEIVVLIPRQPASCAFVTPSIVTVMCSRLPVMSTAFFDLAYSVIPLLPHQTSFVPSKPMPVSLAQVVIVALPLGPWVRDQTLYDGVHGVSGSASAQ